MRHSRWSDGRLSIREIVDLYGQTARFDVIAITDHIVMKRDVLARAGRLASLGYRRFSATAEGFHDYLAEIESEGRRARRLYDLLLVPGAEITPNHLRSRKNSHIVALNTREFISADQPAEDILRDIRRQGALSIACHPHHRTTRRFEIGTCYLWDHRYDHVMGPIVASSQTGYDALTGAGHCGDAPEGDRAPSDQSGPGRCGYGPRVPLLVISAFAKANFIDSGVTDQASILRFIEDNWHLGRIGNGSFDAIAASLLNMFDLDREDPAPRLFLDPRTGQPIDDGAGRAR